MSLVAGLSYSKNGNNENSRGLPGARRSRCLAAPDLLGPRKAPPPPDSSATGISAFMLQLGPEAGPGPIFKVATASFCTISFQTNSFPFGEVIRARPGWAGPDFCPGHSPEVGRTGGCGAGRTDGPGLILDWRCRQGCCGTSCLPRAPRTQEVLFQSWNTAVLQTRTSLLGGERCSGMAVAQVTI